ncbi:hypothetical protein J45TS6_40280 [Paenibacillus sp. J45TS6]|uniref:DNA-binding protein n=1 Tax=Paenibacillus sp. J45TS6 TaxID=2807196 RepID=UPI001B222661|nr:DNA-binding protein [Paenibacillus sp. J45TS6]GIP45569.1 hypothetical protein J45TS6_40280 [Paenibacillus sp. J45TS6]
MKNLSNVICSIILGIAIITGCFIIKGSQLSISSATDNNEISNKALMTIQETAKYLNITESQVHTIISTEETMLKTQGSYTGMLFPIFKIGEDILVSTTLLNDWIKESIQLRKEY